MKKLDSKEKQKLKKKEAMELPEVSLYFYLFNHKAETNNFIKSSLERIHLWERINDRIYWR